MNIIAEKPKTRKPTIEIEYPNGDRESFVVPRRLIREIADAMADSWQHGYRLINVILDKRTYHVMGRENLNPSWKLQNPVGDEPTDHTRHSVAGLRKVGAA